MSPAFRFLFASSVSLVFACSGSGAPAGGDGDGGDGDLPGTGGMGGPGSGGGVEPGDGDGDLLPPGTGGSAGGSGTGGVIEPGTGGVDPGTGGAGTGGLNDPSTGGTGTGGGGDVPPGTWNAPIVDDAATAAASEYAAWHSKYFEDCGDETACIRDGSRCVSEGIGYGMLAAVSEGDQPTFDKLWAFYKKHKNPNGVMKWQIAACGEAMDQNGATDAELDAAYALIQAHSRWGDATYSSDATTLITAIKTHETETCGERIILKPGDNWGGCSDQSQNRVNPSYFAPGYYRAFATQVPDQAADWNKMVTDTYDLFDIYQARLGGLIPDWAGTDGSDWYGAGYGYESVRAPWRVAVDYGLSGDARALTVLQKLADFATANGGPAGVNYDNNSAFRGSFATSGLVDQATADSFYASWMGASGMDDQPYYQGTLRILFVQVMGGVFYVP